MRTGALLLSLLLVAAGCKVREAAAESPPGQGMTALVGGTLVHPERTGGAALQRATLLLSGGRIHSVLDDGRAAPEGARVVDARGKWIIPGLIDSHVHFFQSGGPFTRPDVVDLTSVVPYDEEVARVRSTVEGTLRRWVESGVTGVVDLGGPAWVFDLRERARAMELAPRVAVAGALISTIAVPELELPSHVPIRKVALPAEAASLAREQVRQRPDLLKFWLIHRPGDDLRAQARLIEAVAQVAREARVPLVVHATELETAKAALRAGANILAHSVSDRLVDDELLELARRKRAIYIPTLFVSRGYDLVLSGEWEPTAAERRLADPAILATMKEGAVQPGRVPELPRVAMANLRRVWDAGVVVAAGSDAGNIGTLHGPGLFRELELMGRAGLSPREVLLAATAHGAQVLGRESSTGRIAAGFEADLVVLEANPLDDVGNLSRISRVFRAGRELEPRR